MGRTTAADELGCRRPTGRSAAP
uniref:Uncharacterized protein n=1 Tax=Arundo donax TaxID=35708 RepID=A0A0A8ZTW2_ARUDO